ncbi:hypothetical protein R1flu_005041 [Riccia fluitans]|uniref:Uncharacterized protein n=1 Tax=Riccia fluitans TaxID=41844 RepID=A0ABD1YW02_9MARC
MFVLRWDAQIGESVGENTEAFPAEVFPFKAGIIPFCYCYRVTMVRISASSIYVSNRGKLHLWFKCRVPMMYHDKMTTHVAGRVWFARGVARWLIQRPGSGAAELQAPHRCDRPRRRQTPGERHKALESICRPRVQVIRAFPMSECDEGG